MSESSNLYRGVDRNEKDSSFTKEQGSVGIKEKGQQFLKQIENRFKARKALRAIEFHKVCRERVNRFWDLSSIDSDFKVFHFRKFYRHIVKITKVDLQEKRLSDYGVRSLYGLGILGVILPNWIFVGSALKDKLMLLNWMGINIVYLAIISIFLFIIYRSIKRPLPGARNTKYRVQAALFSPPMTTLFCMVMFHLPPIKYADGSLFSMISKVTIWGFFDSIFTFIFLVYPTLIIALKRQRTYCADSILVNGFLEVLTEIEKGSSLAYRASTSRIWRKVKDLAKDLQSPYIGAFRSNKTFIGIGYALYAYESWLDDPKNHTREDLKARIAEKLKHAISGNLGEIEKSYPKGFSFRKPLQEIVSFITILSVFGAPFLIQKMIEILSLRSTMLESTLPNIYVAFYLFGLLVLVIRYVVIDKESLNKLLDLVPILLRVKKD